VWYNKDLFATAGITAPPTTWDEFLTAVDKLKAASIVPIALAGKDRWVGLHLWTYVVLRYGGADALAEMNLSGNWDTDACKGGGAELAKLVAKNPFQPGFLSAAYDKGEAVAMGNGLAAMEVMGEWAPNVQIANSTSGTGIGDALGWFRFPAITGGAGAPTDGVGGGGGFAVGSNASPEAIDFLHSMVSLENGNKWNLAGLGFSPVVGTSDTIKDPLLQIVLAALNEAEFVQTFQNVAAGVTPEQAEVMMDGTAALFAGVTTPEEMCKTISR
jgi:raffinose/stachyose/melibiose transport system substrate-binding protein